MWILAFFFLLSSLIAHGVSEAGIPPTVATWYLIPSTRLDAVCPSDTATFGLCKQVTIYGSGALDQNNSILYLMGGGGTVYNGNEVYALHLSTLTVTATLPTTPVAAVATSPDTIGTPGVSNSKRPFDGMVWVDELAKFLLIGGSAAKAGGTVNSIWLYDPAAANPWNTRLTDDYTTSGSGKTTIIGAPSPSGSVWAVAKAFLQNTNGSFSPVVLAFNGTNLFVIDPVLNTMRKVTSRTTAVAGSFSVAYDSKRKLFVVLGGTGTTFATFNMSGGPTAQVPGSGDASLVSRPTTGATAIAGAIGPGVVYDPDQDRIVAWGSTSINTVYIADMDKALAGAADTWATTTVSGAPDPVIETANRGVFHRFQYVQRMRLYTYCGDVSTNCWAFRLVTPDNSVGIKETSGSTQTNRPLTRGRVFRQGDIPNCPEAWIAGAAVTTQTDVKSRWPDGSLKFGLVSFVIPSMASGSTTTVTFINNEAATACHNTGGLTAAQAVGGSYDFDVKMSVVGTSTKTASAYTMLNTVSPAATGTDVVAWANAHGWTQFAAGLTANVLTDITGATRPNPPDLGAYSYAPLGLPVIPPASDLASDCTYYIAPNGVNTNNGTTPTTPKLLTGTNSASALATAPAVICFKAGTYAQGYFTVPRGGANGNWIVYKAYGDGPVLIRWSGTTRESSSYTGGVGAPFYMSGLQYVAIEGMQIDCANAASPNTPAQNGIWFRLSFHMRALNNTIQNCGEGGVVSRQGDYIEVRNNRMWHNGYVGKGNASGVSLNQQSWNGQTIGSNPGFHSFVVGNMISGQYDNHVAESNPAAHTDGNGIIMDLNQNATDDNANATSPGTPPVLIANNVVFNNGGRCLEQLAVRYTWIINNTCYKNTLDEAVPNSGEITARNSVDGVVMNNVAQNWIGTNSHPSYFQNGTNTNQTYLTNLWFGTAPSSGITTSPPAPQLFRNLDPQFLLPPAITAQTVPPPALGSGQYSTAISWSQLSTGLELQPTAWRYWAQGSVMTDFIIEDRSVARAFDMDPNADGARALHPIFDCRFYPINSKVECSAILENDWVSNTVGNSTRDESITYSITSGRASPAAKAVNWKGDTSEALTTHKFTGMSRSHIVVPIGAAMGAVLVDDNLAYLGSTHLLPNFDSTLTLNANRLNTEKTAWSGLSSEKTIQGAFDSVTNPIGNWGRIGSEAYGPQVGLLPTWDVMYLYAMSGFDQTMNDKMLGNADLLGRQQIHNREVDSAAGRGVYYDAVYAPGVHTSPYGRPVSIAARKALSAQNYATTCSVTPATDVINTGTVTSEWTSAFSRIGPPYAPGASYLPYLLTGRYFYMEEMQFRAAYNLAWQNPCLSANDRMEDAGYVRVERGANPTQGAAWTIRDLAYAYTVSPDGTPEQAYFNWYLKQNRAITEGIAALPNTDSQHQTARDYGFTKTPAAPDGASPLGLWGRFASDLTNVVLRSDGSPFRNVKACNGAGFTCAGNPLEENMFVAALGMAHGTGIDMTTLLNFRAKYNFGPAIGLVDTAYGGVTRIPGKVELSYSGGSGQGWMPDWNPHLSQYANTVTVFDTSAGSDQGAGYINLGALAFLAPAASVYNTDGAAAYTAMRAAMDTDLSTVASHFDGSLNTGSVSTDSPKWDILPWSSSVVVSSPGQAPTSPSNVTVVIH